MGQNSLGDIVVEILLDQTSQNQLIVNKEGSKIIKSGARASKEEAVGDQMAMGSS